MDVRESHAPSVGLAGSAGAILASVAKVAGRSSDGAVPTLRLAGYGVVLVAITIAAFVVIRRSTDTITILPAPEVPPLDDVLIANLEGFIVQYSGPSPNRALTSDAIQLVEARRQALVESGLTAFLRPDISAGVVIEIAVVRADGWGRAFLGSWSADPDESVDGYPVGTRIRVTGRDEGWFEIRSQVVEGAYGVEVSAFGTGEHAEDEARAVLETVTNDQHRLLQQPAALPTLDGISLERGRLALLSMEINIVVVGAMLLGLTTMLADRAARRRLLLRLRGRADTPPPVGTSDVRAAAHAALQQGRWRGGLTIMALVTLVVAAAALRLTIVQSGVFLAVGVVVHGFLLRLIGLDRRSVGASHPRLRGWALATSIPLVFATMMLVFLGGTAIWIAAAVDAIGVINPDDLSLDEYQRLSLIVGVVALAASPAPLLLARRLGAVRHGRHLAADDRTPTLFLRSFADDGLRMRSRSVGDVSTFDRLTLRRWERFEEVVARAVHSIGPIRALTDPGTRLPQLGAVRERVSDDAWRGRIAELIESSSLIVVSLARTEHCVMEIRDLQERGALHKTLFVVAPVAQKERRKRLDVLARTLELPASAFDFESGDTVVLGVVVHPMLGIRAFTSNASDDVSYQLAVVKAQDFLESEWRQALPAPQVLNPGYVPVDWGAEPLIWAPGAAPRYRSWLRRTPGIVVGAILLSTVAQNLGGLVAKTATGTPIAIGGQVQRLIVDGSTGDVLALAFDGGLLSLDLDSMSAQPVGSLGEPMTSVSADAGHVVGVHAQNRVLAAVDMTSGSSWSVELDERPTEVSVIADTVLVTFADDELLRTYELDSGSLLDEAELAGAPWGVAPSETAGQAFVSLAERDLIVEVSVDDLSVVDEFEAPEAPKDLQRSSTGWTVVTAYRAGLAGFDPAEGWWPLLDANKVYPSGSTGDWSLPSLDTGNGQNSQLSALLPDRGEPCVLELTAPFHSYVVTASGAVIVSFTGHPGVEVFDPSECL